MGRYITAEGWIVAGGAYGKREYRAYMPHPLAGWSPSVSADMMSSLNSASDALASLASRRSSRAGLGEWMTARDESIRSSAIEGVHSTAAGLAWAHYRDAAGMPVSDDNDALTLGASRQVDAAVGLGRRMRSGHRCSLDDVLALHKTLFSGTRDEPIGGRLRDSQADGLPQEIEEGDSAGSLLGDDLSVRVPLEQDPVVHRVTVTPNPFTPNGDGINDQTIISYDLLHLISDVPVSLQVYDLAGKQVAELPVEKNQSGRHLIHWNGQNDQGRYLPPGLYILQVKVATDSGTVSHSSPIAVIY